MRSDAARTVRIPAAGAQPWLQTAQPAPEIIGRLKSLRCLAAVAMHGSAVRAAQALFISQPAVTRAILELERTYGVELFDRGARGMVPTAAGQRAARRAQSLLDHLAHGAEEAAALAAPSERRVSAPQRFAGAVSVISLAALLAISQAVSESGAALQLGITQPAVNRALRGLEYLVGIPLLRRSLRGSRLTDSGEAMLRRIKLAWAEARAIECDLAAWRGEVRGRVVIGALPLSVGLFLPQALSSVGRARAAVEITVVDGTFESLLKQLRDGDIDVIVGALRPSPTDVRQETLFEEPLAVTARIGHPCFERASLTLADLLEWEWVVPLGGTPASGALHHAFVSLGLEPPAPSLQANNVAFTRAMLRCSDRLAIASRDQALEDERCGRLRLVPVELPGTRRAIGVAVREASEPSPDLAAVLEALRGAATELKEAHKGNA